MSAPADWPGRLIGLREVTRGLGADVGCELAFALDDAIDAGAIKVHVQPLDGDAGAWWELSDVVPGWRAMRNELIARRLACWLVCCAPRHPVSAFDVRLGQIATGGPTPWPGRAGEYAARLLENMQDAAEAPNPAEIKRLLDFNRGECASDRDYGIGLDLRWLSGDVRAGFHARDGDGPQWAVNPLLDKLLFGDTEGLRAGDERIQAQHRALWGDETESRHRRPPA